MPSAGIRMDKKHPECGNLVQIRALQTSLHSFRNQHSISQIYKKPINCASRVKIHINFLPQKMTIPGLPTRSYFSQALNADYNQQRWWQLKERRAAHLPAHEIADCHQKLFPSIQNIPSIFPFNNGSRKSQRHLSNPDGSLGEWLCVCL